MILARWRIDYGSRVHRLNFRKKLWRWASTVRNLKFENGIQKEERGQPPWLPTQSAAAPARNALHRGPCQIPPIPLPYQLKNPQVLYPSPLFLKILLYAIPF